MPYKIFRKEKLIHRLSTEGRLHLIDSKKMTAINNIDGKIAIPDEWQQSLYDETDTYVCTTDNGEKFLVKAIDCDAALD